MDLIAQLADALKDRYALDSRIGAGGMATVYLARDVRHKRKVALKVLNPELGAVLGVERFLSEIQVTANLQHPNLLPLFDSGEASGLLYYVMPYVEGESLRELLGREKQLPVDQALHIATAVASALDYAHRHGVIHRDLKPENILMHDGQPLVADFGIALAVKNAGGNRITQTGLSLGTPHYMSPEQATGDRDIDARTDVYSLAAVTYEMLVGEPPHDGKTSQAIIAKMLTDKPRGIRLARESVPDHVEAAVLRALAKLPADRYHSAHAFAEALAGKGQPPVIPAASAVPTAAAPLAAVPASRLRTTTPWAVAAVALVAGGLGWWKAVQPPHRGSVLRYEVPVPGSTTLPVGRGNTVAISSDGRFIAFAAQTPAGNTRIFLRAADELQPREVPGTERAIFPFFSPNGDWIGFWTGGQLMRAPVSGGAPVVVGDAAAGVAAWTPSGWIVSSNATALTRAPATGGTFVPFTRMDSAQGETGQWNPVALPDGKSVLYSSFTMGGAATARIGVASLEDGSTTILDLQGTFPLGILDGFLIYVNAAGTIMAARYDHGSRRVTGEAIALVDQAATDAASSGAYAQMSLDGSLVYVSGVSRRQLVIRSPDGRIRTLGDPGPLSWPRVSRDGAQVAVSVGSLSQRDVWLFDIESGSSSRFTTTGEINDRPEWAPDGRSLLFRSNREPPNAIWIQRLDGRPATKLVSAAPAHVDEGVMSPDGKFVLYQRDSTGNGEVWFRGLQGDTTLVHMDEGGNGDYGARFSPDGRWIVYTSGASGVAQVYVRAFPELTRRVQVSVNGGTTPVWAPDGKRIYYANGSELWVATIASTQPFTIASRSVVLDRGYTFNNVHADYDVMADGSIVALRSPGQDQQLVVVRNLGAELRDRLRSTSR